MTPCEPFHHLSFHHLSSSSRAVTAPTPCFASLPRRRRSGETLKYCFLLFGGSENTALQHVQAGPLQVTPLPTSATPVAFCSTSIAPPQLQSQWRIPTAAHRSPLHSRSPYGESLLCSCELIVGAGGAAAQIPLDRWVFNTEAHPLPIRH